MNAASGFDETALRRAAEEVIGWLRAGEHAAIAQRYGYALAYGRPLPTAIEEDLRSALASLGVGPDGLGDPTFELVRYPPNDSGLLGALECACLAREGAGLLVDLVVAQAAEPRITLEDIGAFGVD